MAHTIRDKTKLLHRVRRVRGQLNAVEKALVAQRDCSTILLTVAACRRAMDSLMAEIIEGHIQFHMLDNQEQKSTSSQKKAAQEIISVLRRYLK
jgi:FrmR/RcnR family transcriptional regulator, repressor of frmRAB operon